MTVKIISTYVASYTIPNGVNLYITGSGEVGGDGIGTLYNTTIVNDGVVNGHRFGGIVMAAGGSLTNGSASYVGAVIEGSYGVAAGGASAFIRNFGIIQGVDSIYGAGDGVDLEDGGTVINGSATDGYARIVGDTGIVIGNAFGSVSNFGRIIGHGDSGDGVDLQAGGRVTNGTNRDTTALIEGYSGVVLSGGSGYVINYGTINAAGAYTGDSGVYLRAGGSVINGAGTDRGALIEGGAGVVIAGGAGQVSNSGTIEGTAEAFAVALDAGGALVNGSATNATALIEGVAGLYMYGGIAQNFGTIVGQGDNDIGVSLDNGASLYNGSFGHTGALIEGYIGVYGGGAETVTNFGTIEGEGDSAIAFRSQADVLNVEAGSTFIGANFGGGGTLDLASGTGTIANLGAAALTVSGSMAATTFQNFNTVEVGAGATFTDAATLTLTAAGTVISAGTLTLGAAGKAVTSAGVIETTGAGVLTITGALKNTGTIATNGGILTVKGAVTGTGGVARIDGGTLDLGAGFTQNVSFTGTTGVLELAQSQGYSGDIFGFSKTGKTSLDLLDITFGKATTATFSGTTAGGILTVTDGTHTALINLKGNYTTSTFVTSSDGHGGTTVVDPKAKAPALAFIAAAAGLGGSAGSAIQAANAWAVHAPMLARPGAAAA